MTAHSLRICVLSMVAAASVAAVQAQQAASSAPVADATRAWLQMDAKNLIAAAEEMPDGKYDFRPTPQQMTFAHLMSHIIETNRYMCSTIAGGAVPNDPIPTDKEGKVKLVAGVRASFDRCAGLLAKVDDSRLGEQLPLFKRTRANLMMFLAADHADHYATAAIYLRLNGLLPPTAQPKPTSKN